jgi:hypothetical protein
MLAQAQLIEAQVALSSRSPANAHQMAEAATTYFRDNNLTKSEWAALLYDAFALRALGNATASAAKARESRQVLEQLRTQWPTEDFRAWIARPDVKQQLSIMNAYPAAKK